MTAALVTGGAIVNEQNGIGHCPSTGQSAARTARVVDRMLATLR